MAQILTSINNPNKEYSEARYRYEKQIQEYEELIQQEKDKKETNWPQERETYLKDFDKKHFYIIKIIIAAYMLLVIFWTVLLSAIIISTNHIPFMELISFCFLTVISLFLDVAVYRLIGILLSIHHVSQLNIASQNKISEYQKQIKELKKHYKINFNYSRTKTEKPFIENSGKRSFALFIKKNLPENVFLINDIEIKTKNQTYCIDHIIVSPKGVFCVDIKSYDKTYYVSNNYWKYYSQDSEYEINNPQEIISNKAELLEKKLGNLHLQIVPIVVFTHPNGQLIGESINKCKVINMSNFLEYYNDKVIIFSDKQVYTIAQKIIALFRDI